MGKELKLLAMVENTSDKRAVDIEEVLEKLNKGLSKRADMLLAPPLFLTPGRGDYLLIRDRILLLEGLVEETKEEKTLIVPGSFLIAEMDDRLYESSLVVSRGENLGPNYRLFSESEEHKKAAKKLGKKPGFGDGMPFIVRDSSGFLYGLELGEDHTHQKLGVLGNYYKKTSLSEKLDFHFYLGSGQITSNYLWTLKEGGYFVFLDGVLATSQVIRKRGERGEMLQPAEVSKSFEIYDLELTK